MRYKRRVSLADGDYHFMLWRGEATPREMVTRLSDYPLQPRKDARLIDRLTNQVTEQYAVGRIGPGLAVVADDFPSRASDYLVRKFFFDGSGELLLFSCSREYVFFRFYTGERLRRGVRVLRRDGLYEDVGAPLECEPHGWRQFQNDARHHAALDIAMNLSALFLGQRFDEVDTEKVTVQCFERASYIDAQSLRTQHQALALAVEANVPSDDIPLLASKRSFASSGAVCDNGRYVGVAEVTAAIVGAMEPMLAEHGFKWLKSKKAFRRKFPGGVHSIALVSYDYVHYEFDFFF